MHVLKWAKQKIDFKYHFIVKKLSLASYPSKKMVIFYQKMKILMVNFSQNNTVHGSSLAFVIVNPPIIYIYI